MIRENQLSRGICKERLIKILNISIKYTFLFFICFFIIGCNKRELSVGDFVSKMENKGYSVVDISDDVKNVVLAVGNHFQVYYYKFDNSSLAHENLNKEIKSLKSGNNNIVEELNDNYEKYIVKNSRVFSIYSRINNTYIHISAVLKHKVDVEKLVDYIGY